MAAMLRADLAEARKQWLQEAIRDPDEYSRRDKSDFLAPEISFVMVAKYCPLVELGNVSGVR